MKRKNGQPTNKNRSFTKPNYAYQVSNNKFRGHQPGQAEIERRRPANLTNHAHMLIKAEMRKKRKEMENASRPEATS